ncbi:uncharacterized protein TNCV_2683191 [Trichonephila clavipes]|nr:uncharacterized protein TNCV_2683191 [Trichonephila clavipes]
MMEAGWSARRVGRSDCVVRRCWNQRIREMSFTRRPDSERPRQVSRREDRHNIRNARVQPTASSAVIQAQVVPSLEALVSSRTMSRRPLIHISVWNDVMHEKTGLQQNGTRSSLAPNSNSISEVMTIVIVCGDLAVNASILPLLYSDTPLPQLV